MVLREMPVAVLTALTPPQPKACASVAAHWRRTRWSINGESMRNGRVKTHRARGFLARFFE